MDLRFAVFILTRIELPPTWRFYPARLVRLERFVFKETTHTAVPHVDLLPRATRVVTISGNYSGRFLIANCAGKKCTARCIFNENKLRTHDTTLGRARCGTYLSNENLGFIHANNIPRGLRANKMISKERVIYAKCKA